MHMTTARVLRLPEVQARIGLGRDSIYRLVRAGLLSAPVKISARASGWLERDVESFIAQRVAERDDALLAGMRARGVVVIGKERGHEHS